MIFVDRYDVQQGPLAFSLIYEGGFEVTRCRARGMPRDGVTRPLPEISIWERKLRGMRYFGRTNILFLAGWLLYTTFVYVPVFCLDEDDEVF